LSTWEASLRDRRRAHFQSFGRPKYLHIDAQRVQYGAIGQQPCDSELP
jgi:hypothetical protein